MREIYQSEIVAMFVADFFLKCQIHASPGAFCINYSGLILLSTYTNLYPTGLNLCPMVLC